MRATKKMKELRTIDQKIGKTDSCYACNSKIERFAYN